METPILTAESITPVTLLKVIGTTSVLHLPEQTAKAQHDMILLTTFAPKAGDYQLTVSLALLLALATYPLSLLLLAGTTTVDGSSVLATATGGPLLRTLATISASCTTIIVVACVPAATASSTGAMYGVYGLASTL